MRKLFVSCITSIALLAAIPSMASAQSSLLLGMMIGSAMSSGSIQGDISPNVLYVMPRAAERIKDPLAMRTAQSGPSYDKYPIRERFNAAIGRGADNYELLQVVRVADQGNADRIYLWFTYIDKSLVTPLAQLPPLAQNNK